MDAGLLITILGTSLCVGLTLSFGAVTIPGLTPAQFKRAFVIDLVLPMALAAPFFFLLNYKMRQLAIAYQKLMVIATTDGLTDVLNRRAFTANVEAALKQPQTVPLSGAFLVVDADNFKTINDRLGHEKGDVALKMIASAIKANIRERDVVGRIGGEEFAILLSDVCRTQANEAAERIRKGVSETPFRADGIGWPLTISVGGVSFQNSASYEKLFIRADHQLYVAKAAGRNRVSMEHLEAGPSIG